MCESKKPVWRLINLCLHIANSIEKTFFFAKLSHISVF
jgi:hypothetical protein